MTIIQVPRAENENADALARLATGLEERLLKTVPIEVLETPSIDKLKQVGSIIIRPCWMDPILSFLRDGTLPEDKFEARRLRHRSARYFLDKGKLYKKGLSSPCLLCLDEDRGKFTLEEVHAGLCGNHPSGRTLAHKILRQGWKNIVCRFSVPRELVSDHGTQFENEKLQSICDRLRIKKVFLSPAHPKSNSQVKAVNKTIKQTLKKKLEKSKGAWVDELPLVLWSYRTSF
ncbi:hypothetical protein UlMin_042473 [Ulmus minor]